MLDQFLWGHSSRVCEFLVYLEIQSYVHSFRQTLELHITKPVLSGHSKTDKTKVLKTNGSLMKVKSIAECSLGAFCNTFGLH